MVPCHHGEQTAGPGRGGGSPRRGGRTPAPGRPLELLGAVPPPDRPSTDAWLRAVQQRGVSCRRCRVCSEEADTPRHVLLRCPALAGRRLRRLGTINPEATEVRDDGVVAALAAGYRAN